MGKLPEKRILDELVEHHGAWVDAAYEDIKALRLCLEVAMREIENLSGGGRIGDGTFETISAARTILWGEEHGDFHNTEEEAAEWLRGQLERAKKLDK